MTLHMFVMFAQNRPPVGPAMDIGGPTALIIGLCEFVAGAVILAFQIYYLITLYKAFNLVSPRNREMEPAMIFLLLVPCFSLIWYFFVVTRLASSLEKEYRARGLKSDDDFGRQMGIIAGALNLTLCLALFGLVCQILHLLKVRTYVEKLEKSGKIGRIRADDDEETEEEERPRRKRRRDEDDI